MGLLACMLTVPLVRCACSLLGFDATGRAQSALAPGVGLTHVPPTLLVSGSSHAGLH